MNVNVCNKLFKRELWSDIRFPEGHVYEDAVACFKLFDKADRVVLIDESLYNGIVDYEVECESTSMEHAKELLEEFLNNKKIPFNWNHISKLKRARDSILKSR